MYYDDLLKLVASIKWSKDVSKAPKGHMETRKIGKNMAEIFVPDRVILATKCGKVTLSYWHPEKDDKPGRWNMLNQGEEPVAWFPWPEYPSESI